MKELSAVALEAKAFPANFVKSGSSNNLKTASASFDSFLGTSSSKTEAVQPKTDTQQFAVSNKAQTETAQTQPDDNVSKDTVQTDTAKETQNTKAPVTDTDITEEDVSDVNEVVTSLNQSIRDIIKDITGMDDEMLVNAMSALGLVETDLLDTSNLAKLVLMLNGSSDMTDLLANEYMMSQFNDISDALKDIDWEALTGMSQEEFMPLLESMTADDGMADVGPDIGIPVTVEYVEEDIATITEQAEDTDILPVVTKETANTDDTTVKQTDNATQEDKSIIYDKVNTDNGTEQSESFNQGADSQTDGQVQSAQTEIRTSVHNEVLNGTEGFLQNLNQAVADVTGEAIPQQSSMQQMIDIVNQVVEQIKVTLGRETTSMQLQLNPESLGKVLISVSSTHGVMTANFTVQTEEAKEALQSQMYQLREALESRSLKVDAVEVEVSDFAFSQSSQADAQNQKEFEKGNGRRFRFDFDDSSEDEDSTVSSAQRQERKARPNLGSSIDFTA